MSEESFGGKIKELYKALCQEEWNAYTVGILVAFFSVLILAWMRPWGAVGAIRNWGDWIMYGIGIFDEAPKGIFKNSGSDPTADGGPEYRCIRSFERLHGAIVNIRLQLVPNR